MVQENKFCYRYSSQTAILFLLWTLSVFCGFWIIIDIYKVTEESQILPKEYSWNSFKIILALFYKITLLIVSIIGLYGIIKKKTQYLAIFYYYNYFQLLLISLFIAYLLLYPIEANNSLILRTETIKNQVKTTYLTFILLLTGLGLQIYFTIVVKNHYEMMKEQHTSRSHILIFSYPEYCNYGFV